MRAAAVVFRKELRDALRDRRTWIVVLLSSLLAGPVSLLLIASFVSSAEESAARREVIIANATAAPTLVNYLQAQRCDDPRCTGGLPRTGAIRPPAECGGRDSRRLRPAPRGR